MNESPIQRSTTPQSAVLTTPHDVHPSESCVGRQGLNHLCAQCPAGGPSKVGCQLLLNKAAFRTKLLNTRLSIFSLYRQGLKEQVSSTALALVPQKQSPWLGFKHRWCICKMIPGNTNRIVEKWNMEVKGFKIRCVKEYGVLGNWNVTSNYTPKKWEVFTHPGHHWLTVLTSAYSCHQREPSSTDVQVLGVGSHRMSRCWDVSREPTSTTGT